MDEEVFPSQNYFAKWEARDLTLQRKILFINSYVVSGLNFMSEIYTVHVPKKVIDETKRLFVKFLWGGSTWRVAQKNYDIKKLPWRLKAPRSRWTDIRQTVNIDYQNPF